MFKKSIKMIIFLGLGVTFFLSLLITSPTAFSQTLIWEKVNSNGFGDVNNGGTSLVGFGDYLYVGADNSATGGEIWRTKGVGGPPFTDWEQVNINGFGDSNNEDVSPMVVYDGYLYAGTENQTIGGEIWRSSDGTTWEKVNANGFGDINNGDTIPFIAFDGYLYAGTTNLITGGEIWRTKGVGGPPFTDWEKVNTNGFGDVNNMEVFPTAIFGDYLYVEASNNVTGCEIWRTKAVGGPPFTDWEQVNINGFGDNNGDTFLQVFGDYLYAGTENNIAGGKIWRTKAVGGPPFTDWEQINIEGFDNMGVFEGFLYVGTENVTTGGKVYRSSNGTTWEQVNIDGFGNVNNEKARSIVGFGDYLYVGTDNTTGCEVWRTSGETGGGGGNGGAVDGGNEDDDNGCFIGTVTLNSLKPCIFAR